MPSLVFKLALSLASTWTGRKGSFARPPLECDDISEKCEASLKSVEMGPCFLQLMCHHCGPDGETPLHNKLSLSPQAPSLVSAMMTVSSSHTMCESAFHT
jgi:hypothetical protein